MTEPQSAPFGRRLRAHRERAGKTRAVLGGLVGRSGEWVKAVETGRLLMPRLPMLLRLAEVLDLDDVAELTGNQSVPVATLAFGEHPAVPAVRAAVQRYTLGRPCNPTFPVPVLRSRVDDAWQIWHESLTRRTDVGALLPALLVDCQDSALALAGTERRAVHAVLSDVYHLTQHALVNAAVPELLWLVVERAMATAQIADEPLALAGAAWTAGMMLRLESGVLGLILIQPRCRAGNDMWRRYRALLRDASEQPVGARQVSGNLRG